MGEKLFIGQVKQSGGIISHFVDDTRQIEDGTEAAVISLVWGLYS
jgi:hypothetical protein